MWIHLSVETTVRGGKNGDPISHWRPAGSFLYRTSLGQRTRTLAFSIFFRVLCRARLHYFTAILGPSIGGPSPKYNAIVLRPVWNCF